MRLIELELLDRGARPVERRIRDARVPAVKSLESFAFDAIPGLDKKLVLDLARCEFVARRENVIALGPSGAGKTHTVCGIGLAACQRGVKTRFAPTAAIVHERIEAQDEKRLLRLQKTLAAYELPSSGLRGRSCGHGPSSTSTNWASRRCRAPGQNCRSNRSASATSAPPPSAPRI